MSKPSIVTKSDLLELIADRKNDLQQNNLELTPPWAPERGDADWQSIRDRENKIEQITETFDRKQQQFEDDFDMSS